ncbi:MAG TPA: transcriptional repressor [Terriglobales bacterium]|nr:transcriptional repressor [Terriglobales bacterium]
MARAVRNTVQRKLVLDIVRERRDHPTAEQVFEVARRRDCHISRGTVYRNLNLLSELGELKRLSMPVGPDHFDIQSDNHYHFCCRGCGTVTDAMLPYREEFNRVPDALTGYKIEWHRLVLVGLCPECQKKENEHKKQEE